jgi:hypothetical protein
MSEKESSGEVYHLEGPGIVLTYRPSTGKVDVKSEDDTLLRREDLDVVLAEEPNVGLRLTGTLLESSRNGTRVMLTVLLPDVRWIRTSHAPEPITGVVIVTRSFTNLIGGAPVVLQSYDDVHRLEGTVSPRG